MTRGRKRNLDLPPSRSLEQQRAFRARKAQYVSDLEERCHKFEEENLALRQEVAFLRASLPVQAAGTIGNPELIRASLELMHNLASTSASLTRFQQLAETGGLSNPAAENASSFVYPSVVPPPASHHPVPQYTHSSDSSPVVDEDELQDSVSNSSDDLYSPNCCSGFMDCRSLIEEDDVRKHMSRTRTSGMRSTSQRDCHTQNARNESPH